MTHMLTSRMLEHAASGLSERIFHSNWSSPAWLGTKETKLAIFGGPDGVLYAFDPKPVPDDEFNVLKLAWKYDCNPPEYRTKDGKPIKYATFEGPSEIISTPVVYDGKVYAAIGQDPEHGEGVGMLSCIDASQTGDLSGKALWTYDKVGRAISTPSIADGLVFQAEYDGDLHCLDAKTGKPYWVHATQSRVWASTLVADGKVFIGTEDGEVAILAAGKEMKHLNTVDFGAPIYSSPIVANDTVYIGTQTHLYAVQSK